MHAENHPTTPRVLTDDRSRPPSLERPALLSRHLGGWRLKLYPTAGEAVLAWDRGPTGQGPDQLAEGLVADPREREAEYARRAAGKLRRWIRANRCAYLWTFTFRDPTFSYVDVGLAVDAFFRRVAEHDWSTNAREASAPPFLLVAEPHPDGHGWHLHGATDRYLPHALIAKLWSAGWVFVSRGQTGRRGWAPRTLSRYLAKYLGKSLGDEVVGGCTPRAAGQHRYWVTQGRDPVVVRTWHATFDSAVAHLVATYGPPDAVIEFGLDDPRLVPGAWFDFSDRCVARWLERVQAESRAKRGQP